MKIGLRFGWAWIFDACKKFISSYSVLTFANSMFIVHVYYLNDPRSFT